MKKLRGLILSGLLLLFAADSLAQTKTPNLGLTKPLAAPGSWGADINTNFDILDKAVGGVTSDDQTAAEVPATPFGTIAAKTVQGQLEEIVAEVTAGADNQTAAEVPFIPNGSIGSTNAQDAIVEVRDEAAIATNLTSGTVPTARFSTAMIRRACIIPVGDGTNITVDGDFSPFKNGACYIPYNASLVEILLQGDAGTPTVMVQRRRGAATLADLLSGNLAGAGTTKTCAMFAISQTCTGGTTSSGTITLLNQVLLEGDWLEIKSGVAGGVATTLRVVFTFTVN